MPVTFARNRKVRVYSKVKDSEKDQVWWAPREIKRIRAKCLAFVKLSSSDTPGEELSKEPCLRGLEHWTQEKYKARRKLMRDSILLVLSEQECLKHQGIEDPFAIAYKYNSFAMESRSKAHLRGLEDEKDLIWLNLEESQQRATAGKIPHHTEGQHKSGSKPISLSVMETRRPM